MLTLTDLTTSYGPVRALDSVDMTVEAGRITAVLGANGAGKTSLLRTISGLVRPAAGTVTLNGTDITGAPVESMVHRGMAHVPEGRGVIAELTVEENLRLGARGAAKRPSDTPAPVRTLDDAYQLFPVLGDRRSAQAHTLSGGERQMLVIARALLSRPTLLLLDEPSLGLAPRIVAQIFDLLRTLVADSGLTVLLVEQNARSALSIAHTGVVLNLGKVVVTESAEVLRNDATLRHSYLGF
ncbi:ABC transporter ATP-binding protein [Mumia sp. zg.B17]|uniref:ABC transporter ATP-binding protein n=1 Tax=unclassified Mumia TaxID=2621872 RepID=UPI001C6DE3A2|nr:MULTISPECIES: ABC transporter ATP-binding protein [unclassified Mumia]MBW9205404.1 ABC transporter ATP-binding protein [Mumia sp. zg.B17]MDD9348321.1 ABC transporter ATP-binding protein [Mumia sp.]